MLEFCAAKRQVFIKCFCTLDACFSDTNAVPFILPEMARRGYYVCPPLQSGQLDCKWKHTMNTG